MRGPERRGSGRGWGWRGAARGFGVISFGFCRVGTADLPAQCGQRRASQRRCQLQAAKLTRRQPKAVTRVCFPPGEAPQVQPVRQSLQPELDPEHAHADPRRLQTLCLRILWQRISPERYRRAPAPLAAGRGWEEDFSVYFRYWRLRFVPRYRHPPPVPRELRFRVSFCRGAGDRVSCAPSAGDGGRRCSHGSNGRVLAGFVYFLLRFMPFCFTR